MSTIDEQVINKWVKLTDDFYLDPDGVLGKGAFGEVFRGYSKKNKTLVAIKTLAGQGEGYEREVQTLMSLSSLVHPYIMGFYGFQKRNDVIYICVQFCPNGTLTDRIKQGIPEEEVLVYFRQIIEGMCYMNAKGKMHRDLKPDNVLIGMKQDLKISDFGLARQSNNNMFTNGPISEANLYVTGQTGTPFYAAPEVYLYTEKCDVWGAGMILYEMLTGKPLFENVSTYEALKNQWKQFEIGNKRATYSSNFHPNWQYFTNYLLTYDPKQRPSFHQVLQKLKSVYDKMMNEIKNKVVHKIDEKTIIGKLEIFLKFTQEKYSVLTKISQNFTQKVIPIRSQIKYVIEFLCICHFTCYLRRLIRSLKYKRVRVNQDDDEQLYQQTKECDLLLDKYRNIFDHKCRFYNDQLLNRIVPKLLDDFPKKQQSQNIIGDLKDIWVLISDAKQQTFDVQETYNEAFQNLLKNSIEKYEPGLLQSLKLEQLQIYHLLFMGALLDKKFENKNYLKPNYIKDQLAKIESKTVVQHIKDIKALKKEL